MYIWFFSCLRLYVHSVSAFIYSMFRSVLLPLCLALTLSVSPHESGFLPLLIDSDFATNTMFKGVLLPAEAAGCLFVCMCFTLYVFACVRTPLCPCLGNRKRQDTTACSLLTLICTPLFELSSCTKLVWVVQKRGCSAFLSYKYHLISPVILYISVHLQNIS